MAGMVGELANKLAVKEREISVGQLNKILKGIMPHVDFNAPWSGPVSRLSDNLSVKPREIRA